MAKFCKLAWRNVWRNWRRTAIALVAIVLSVVLLLFFDGMLEGADQTIFGNAVRLYGGNVQVHAPGYLGRVSRYPLLPLEDADAVVRAARAQPHVVAVARRINTTGMVSSREGSYPVVISGIEPEVEAPLSLQAEHVSRGRFLQPGEGDAIVIGKGLAELLQVGVGDRVTLVGRAKNEVMRQRTMTVVGIYDLGMPDAEKVTVLITLPEAQSLYGLHGQATEVAVFLEKVGQERKVLPTLRAALPGYEVDSWQDLRPEIQQTIQTKKAFTSFFGIVLVLIAAIGILNIMMMAVFERTREMGVLAALGMKGRQILGLFLLEGTFIGILGAAAGILLGLLVNLWLGEVGFDVSYASGMGEVSALMGTRIYPSLSAVDVANRGVLVIVVAALASLYPAWQAAHKEPVEALHHV
ncbi:MAG: ABC transporter permease [Anaerolineae bacterium]|nr:ABC transporter permease [Anaerolineae bacterium]